jgi:hypothetical protein
MTQSEQSNEEWQLKGMVVVKEIMEVKLRGTEDRR